MSFPINSMVIFQFAMLNYQRVSIVHQRVLPVDFPFNQSIDSGDFEVKSPTLIIHGKLDEVIPVEHGEVRLPE